jgi:Gpi18-like mannosyltransferase
MASQAASGRELSARVDDGADGQLPRPALSDRLPRAWLFPLLVFAATWALILVTWHVAAAIYGVSMPWRSYFLFKDANFYIWIAQHGYHSPGALPPTVAPAQTAFFPLLPALVKAASYLLAFTTTRYLWAGLLVQVLSGAASAVAVWALAARVRDRWLADRTVLLFCAFPGAMTFGMLYSEPLGIALAAGCLLAAVNHKWLLAGVLGLLGTAEHSTLIVLAPVLGITALHAIWTRRDWWSLIAPVLTPLGMLGYFAYLAPRYHNFFFWFQVEKKGWKSGIDWGVREFHLVTWTDPGATKYTVFNSLVTILFVVAVIGIALLLAARASLPVTLYTVLMSVDLVISASADKPRFIWTTIGIFIGFARLPRWLYWPLVVASAGLLFFLIGWWPQHYRGPAP